MKKLLIENAYPLFHFFMPKLKIGIVRWCHDEHDEIKVIIIIPFYFQSSAKAQAVTALNVWVQTVREGQQSIVFAVCSGATCTEDRQRLERLSQSRQRSFLKEKKKERQKLEEGIARADGIIASGEADAARGKKVFAKLEDNCRKMKELIANIVNKLRLIFISYSLLHSFIH